MCPACIATLALITAGALSTGGLTALVVKKLHTTADAKEIESAIQIKGAKNGSIPSSEDHAE